MTSVPVELQRLDRLKSAARFGLFMLALGAAIASAACLPPSQAPDLQNELQAAAAADKAGDYETAARRYQGILDQLDAANMKPQTLVEIRTRLATLYFLLHRYPDSLRTVEPITEKASAALAVVERP